MYTIYCHINKINGKKYVGQTKQQLEKRYGKNGKGYRKCTLFFRAIQKYGWENFDHEILTTSDTLEEANRLEKLYISILRSNDKEYGYNITEGGDGVSGVHFSEETKKKLSESHKGKCAGEEHYLFGKHLSEETKKKMSDVRKGKHPSVQTEFPSKPVICIETQKIFNSISEAGRWIGKKSAYANISYCLLKKTKTAYGYH